MIEGKWEEQLELMKPLYLGPDNWIRSVHHPEKAFLKKGETLVCMDEGTAHMPMDSKLCLAGSGIVMFRGLPRQERLQKVAELVIGQGAKNITSHAGCGAAKIAAGWDAEWTGTSDEYGMAWSRDLQAEVNRQMGCDGLEGYHHIFAQEMVRPAEFHAAANVWLVATRRRFNPDKLGTQAPLGFVVDLGLSNDEAYSLDVELKTAIGIAFDEGHAFGRYLNEVDRFAITIAADDQDELCRLRNRVNELLLGLDKDRRQRILVDGFLAPAETHHHRVHLNAPAEVRA